MVGRGIKLKRFEVWSDLQCNGGTRLAFYAPLPTSAIRMREVNGAHTLKVALRRDADAWPYVVMDQVVRCVMSDDTFHEWRITKPAEAHEKDGRKIADVECEDPLYDLGHRLIVRTEANGDAYTDFDLYGLTAAEHLAIILGSAQSYFAAGTIDFGSTVKVDLAYRGFSPLQAIRQLAAALPDGGAEVEVTRNGTTNYLVHLRAKVGITAPIVYFRYNRNLDAVRRRRDVTGQPSRVLPLGQDVEGRRFDMADAAWVVTAIAGTTLTLQGAPIAFDDQLNNLYLERAAGSTPTLVSDTLLATQQVVVASAAGIVLNERVHFRRNAAGDDLLYLERPGSGRVRAVVLDRPDVPPVDNLVRNPFLSSWSGGLPVNWAKLGLPTVTEITDPLYHRWGQASAEVVCTAKEQGLETDWVTVAPTEDYPFFGGQISLFVVEGVVRLEIIAEDALATQYIIPDSTAVGGRAFTSVAGQWIDRLAVQDQATNFHELGIVRAKLRIVADRLDAVSGEVAFYLDAAQLAQTHLADLPFYDGLASNALWKAANDELVKWAEPPTQLSVDLVDLYRVDPLAFPHDGLVLGGRVRVDDTQIELSYQNRIVKLVEELVQEGATQVELSEKPQEITDLLNQQLLAERRSGSGQPRGPTGAVDGIPRLDEDDTLLYLFPGKFPAARSVRWVSSATPIVDADVLASSNVSSSEQILVNTFTTDGAQRWVGVAYYPAAGGEGKVGRIHILPPYTYWVGNDVPRVTATELNPGDPGVDRIMLSVIDDGDQVALYYRTYVKGAGPPGYTRVPSSGYVSDPLSQIVSFNRPAEGAANQVIEAYAEDDTSPTPHQSKILYLEMDGDDVPAGWFSTVEHQATGLVSVIPNRVDTDAQSWRFRVKRTTIADASYDLPAFSDVASDEFKGTVFGTPIDITALPLREGERLNVVGYFFRTPTATAAAQASSTKSKEAHAVERQGIPTDNTIEIESHEWVPAVVGGAMGWYLHLNLKVRPQVVSMRVTTVSVSPPLPGGSGSPGSAYNFNFVTVPVPNGATSHVVCQSDGVTPLLWPADTHDHQIACQPYNSVNGSAGSGFAGTAGSLQFPRRPSESGTGSALRSGSTVIPSDQIVVGEGLAGGTDSNGRAKISLDATLSTAAPSGTPSDGELWLRYTP